MPGERSGRQASRQPPGPKELGGLAQSVLFTLRRTEACRGNSESGPSPAHPPFLHLGNTLGHPSGLRGSAQCERNGVPALRGFRSDRERDRKLELEASCPGLAGVGAGRQVWASCSDPPEGPRQVHPGFLGAQHPGLFFSQVGKFRGVKLGFSVSPPGQHQCRGSTSSF